jgi:hypothetical protein
MGRSTLENRNTFRLQEGPLRPSPDGDAVGTGFDLFTGTPPSRPQVSESGSHQGMEPMRNLMPRQEESPTWVDGSWHTRRKTCSFHLQRPPCVEAFSVSFIRYLSCLLNARPPSALCFLRSTRPRRTLRAFQYCRRQRQEQQQGFSQLSANRKRVAGRDGNSTMDCS